MLEILFVTGFALVNCGASLAATTWNVMDVVTGNGTHPSCERNDVNYYAGGRSAMAQSGDTVVIPAGKCGWSAQLAIVKGITLQGSGAGQTIIQDNTMGASKGSLISWMCVANQAHRLTGIEFQNGTRSSPNTNGLIAWTCTNTGTTTLRIDHNKFDHLNGIYLRPDTAVGVADHNVFLSEGGPSGNKFFQFNAPDWNANPGSSAYGDTSWSAPLSWGSSQFFFVEDNSMTFDNNRNGKACVDAYRGARFVIRFNTIVNCNIQNHGTESIGRPRGALAMEVYNNDITTPGFNQIVFLRSGSGLIFNNKAHGLTPVPRAVVLVDDRLATSFPAWFQADGTNRWDVNDIHNPIRSGMATGGSATTVVHSGANFADFSGYIVRKRNCTSSGLNRCAAVILSNTTDTLTFAPDPYAGLGRRTSPLSFANGDAYEINKVVHTIDQPGRIGGSLLSAKIMSSLTSSGTTATATFSMPHGFSTGDWVAISDASIPSYLGIYQVKVTSSTTFTYTFAGGEPTSIGVATKIPPGWNDQQDAPVYQWSNTNDSESVTSALNGCGGKSAPTCRQNEHYFDHDSAFNGSSGGIGVKTKTQMEVITKCIDESLVWVTDEGNWRTGSPNTSGRAYKCVSNKWNLFYTPYTYPHPLQGPSSDIRPQSPR